MLSTRVDDEVEIFLLLPHHAPAFFTLLEANRLYWSEWLSWVPRVTTQDNVTDFIQRGLNELAEGTAIRFGIRYRGDLAGRIFYSYIDTVARRLEIGYQIGQAYVGKGIATRAVRQLVQDAFAEMNMNKVEILCATENTRSRAVPERLGFQQEGILRHSEQINNRYLDLVVYGMLAAEWLARHSMK
jgi:ribosomal-protein-serine acetyltransferase